MNLSCCISIYAIQNKRKMYTHKIFLKLLYLEYKYRMKNVSQRSQFKSLETAGNVWLKTLSSKTTLDFLSLVNSKEAWICTY